MQLRMEIRQAQRHPAFSLRHTPHTSLHPNPQRLNSRTARAPSGTGGWEMVSPVGCSNGIAKNGQETSA